MNWISQYWWPAFTALFIVFLLTSFWMTKVAKHFTLSSTGKPFSIFDLELPPSEKTFIILLNELNKEENRKAKKYVRQQLLIDFLFMPAVYIGIALLCFKTGMKMSVVGKWLFLVLGALQAVAWLFDVIENAYLWKKIVNPPTIVPASNTEKSGSYRSFQFIVKTKFSIAFVGTACSVFGLLYYWIVGAYQKESLPWLGVLVLIVLVPAAISALFKRLKKKQTGQQVSGQLIP